MEERIDEHNIKPNIFRVRQLFLHDIFHDDVTVEQLVEKVSI